MNKPSAIEHARCHASPTAQTWLMHLPVILFLYPLASGLLTTSQNPEILGKYSTALAGFNLWLLVGLVTVSVGAFKGRPRLTQIGLLILFTATYPFPANDRLKDLPLIVPYLQLVRILTVLCIGVCEITLQSPKHRKAGILRRGGIYLVFGISCLDLIVGQINRDGRIADNSLTDRFRNSSISLNRIPDGSILIVGDSLVWGTGVGPDETFGARLGELLEARTKLPPAVFSLGIGGANPKVYNQILEGIGENLNASRIILSFHLNDLPPIRRARASGASALLAINRTAPTLGIVCEYIFKKWSPDLETRYGHLIKNFDTTHETFVARWKSMETQLTQFHSLASPRCRKRPILLILPLLTNYEPYPVKEFHSRLRKSAESIGFEVLDIYPIFRERYGDGSAARVTPNNAHLSAPAHLLVAERLIEKLSKPPSGPTIPFSNTTAQ